MWLRALFIKEIETFFRGPSNSWVCEPRNGRVIIVVLRQAFLDAFDPCEGIYVGDEPLGPGWGDPFVEDVDGWPFWVAEIRWKRIPREYLVDTLKEVQTALERPRVFN
jgi:hypothetical protein